MSTDTATCLKTDLLEQSLSSGRPGEFQKCMGKELYLKKIDLRVPFPTSTDKAAYSKSRPRGRSLKSGLQAQFQTSMDTAPYLKMNRLAL